MRRSLLRSTATEALPTGTARSDLRTRWLVARLARSHDPARTAALRRELAAANLALAETIARRYRHRPVAADALKRVAHEAMADAAQRFDPVRDGDFVAFAAAMVRGAVRRHVRDHGWPLRPASDPQAALAPVTLARVPSAAGPASAALPASAAPTGPEDRSGGGEALAARVMLARALPCLSLQDRRILELRVLEGCDSQEIADRLGLTPRQVCRGTRRALLQLRIAIGSAEVRPQDLAAATAQSQEDRA